MQLLTEAGYEVDIFIRGLGDLIGPMGEVPSGVRILDYRSARVLSAGPLRRWIPARLGVGLGVLLFLALAWKEAKRRHYSAIFGVDAIGGYCGQRIASLVKRPFFYWSLELIFARDAHRLFERVLIYCGRVATRRAAWIVIQDRERANALLRENQPGHARVILVPNGPAGPPHLRSTDFLYRRLGISRDLKIVLHAGMIGDWVLSAALANSVKSWDKSYCLVLHSNEPRRADEPDIKQLLDMPEPRLFLSLEPVAASDVDQLISSAYIGVATYGQGLGPNWDLIVYASGKLGHYLRNGLPVICSEHPGMRELMAKFHCGLVVESMDEVAAALDTISRDYAAYRAGAIECYRQRYEFSAHFGAVLDALARECGQAPVRAETALAWK